MNPHKTAIVALGDNKKHKELVRSLQGEGIRVIEAKSVLGVLKALEQHSGDSVLSDIHINPDIIHSLDGETWGQLRAFYKTIISASPNSASLLIQLLGKIYPQLNNPALQQYAYNIIIHADSSVAGERAMMGPRLQGLQVVDGSSGEIVSGSMASTGSVNDWQLAA